MDNAAYLQFIDYANEKIQRATQCIIQFNDDKNYLEMQKEQLEFLFSIFNLLISSYIDENNENFSTLLDYIRNIQILLNQYVEILNQLEDENFVNINSFISKKMSKYGK
jgi:hypothetical protein